MEEHYIAKYKIRMEEHYIAKYKSQLYLKDCLCTRLAACHAPTLAGISIRSWWHNHGCPAALPPPAAAELAALSAATRRGGCADHQPRPGHRHRVRMRLFTVLMAPGRGLTSNSPRTPRPPPPPPPAAARRRRRRRRYAELELPGKGPTAERLEHLERHGFVLLDGQEAHRPCHRPPAIATRNHARNS